MLIGILSRRPYQRSPVCLLPRRPGRSGLFVPFCPTPNVVTGAQEQLVRRRRGQAQTPSHSEPGFDCTVKSQVIMNSPIPTTWPALLSTFIVVYVGDS